MTALALPLLPLALAAALVALANRPRALGPLAVGGMLATLLLGVWAAVEEPTAAWGWSPLIELGLAVEGFARVMVILVPAIAAPIVAYAAVTEEEGRARLLVLMTVFVGVMLLLVTATDLLTLLIAWELVGATSWALIGHGWRDPHSATSAAQAFVTTRIGDLGLYLAAGLAFAATGSFTYAGLGAAERPLLDAIAAGVLMAAAAKSAQLPFSPWLFSAMAGPTPVSALLHSATLVAAGAYLLVRLAPAFEALGWFLPAVAGIGLATALAGGVVATIQDHAKRVLAASTSAQYGLMFVAVGAGSTAAAGAHLVTHAAFKSLLFLGAGVAIHATGTNLLGGMRLGRVLPLAAALSLVGVLALAAVPPLGAAWSKEEIVAAAVHYSPWIGAGAFVAGFLSVLYAVRYQLLAFGPPREAETAASDPRPLHRPGITELAGLATLAALTLLLAALWLPGGAAIVEDATTGALVEGAAWELLAALGLIIVGAASVVWLWRRGQLVTMGLPSRVQAGAGDWLGLPTAARRLIVQPVFALSAALARLDWVILPGAVRLLIVRPLFTLSDRLARFDDRVIDAGVRGVAAGARLVSRLSAVQGEWSFDGLIRATAWSTMYAAAGSRVVDDDGVDAVVEGTGRGVGLAGRTSRRLQTGQTHHYYVIVSGGVVATVLVLALWGVST